MTERERAAAGKGDCESWATTSPGPVNAVRCGRLLRGWSALMPPQRVPTDWCRGSRDERAWQGQGVTTSQVPAAAKNGRLALTHNLTAGYSGNPAESSLEARPRPLPAEERRKAKRRKAHRPGAPPAGPPPLPPAPPRPPRPRPRPRPLPAFSGFAFAAAKSCTFLRRASRSQASALKCVRRAPLLLTATHLKRGAFSKISGSTTKRM